MKAGILFLLAVFCVALVSPAVAQTDGNAAADLAPAMEMTTLPSGVTKFVWDPYRMESLVLLYDNGPLITHPGPGFPVPDTSRITVGTNTFGFGAQLSTGNRVADDIYVKGGEWVVDSIQFFTYQTGSTTTSTINNVNMLLWDGVPGAGGTVVWGDSADNLLGATYFSNIYRRTTTGGDNTRPIMVATAVPFGLIIPGGRYWFDWQLGGTLTSGPWVPPISIIGQPETGNARQRAGGVWANLVSGAGPVYQQGLPFKVYGTFDPYEKDIKVDSVALAPAVPVVGSPITVSADIVWWGTDPVPATVSLTYKAGSAPTSSGDGVNQVFSPTWVGNEATVTFATGYTPGVPGPLTIYVRAFHIGDEDPTNDTNSQSTTVITDDDIGVSALFYGTGPEPNRPSAAMQSRTGAYEGGVMPDANGPVVSFPFSASINLSAVVENFGSSPQASYQVGWEVDSNPQTPVNNSETLDPADQDTVTLTWGAATPGAHTARAWTILAGDGDASNDTSGVLNFEVLPPGVYLKEGFNNPAFPPPGWIILNEDGGGTTTWARTDTAVFPPQEGSGKATCNYLAANGFVIDEWLITPNTGTSALVSSVDSLTFWARGATGSWPDSIQIRVSTTGTSAGDFTTLIAHIVVPQGAWTRFSYPLPTAANRYVAFRYLHFDGGPSGGSSNFFGIDDVRIFSTVGTSVNAGWNIVSNPVDVTNDSVSALFPTASPGYGFSFTGATGYAQSYTMDNGKGYWVKFPGATGVTFTGSLIPSDSVDVALGWNLIGSISAAVDTGDITSAPSGIVTTPYYNFPYGSGEPQILPGKGYWVKTNAAGKLYLSNSPAPNRPAAARSVFADYNSITITDAAGASQTLYFGTDQGLDLNRFEMPPAPPVEAFDARFETGRILATDAEMVIVVQSLSYPLTVSWNIVQGEYTLHAGATKSLQGEGTMTIQSGNRIVLRGTGAGEIPAEFALEQNYPNPFNPVTNITYALPVESRVTMEVFNALGQRVKVLVNGSQAAGYHTAEWNGTGNADQTLGSGVYFVRLNATGVDGRSFTNLRKMLLLK